MDEKLSIAASVFMVLIVGEILPQSFATGPDQLKIASTFATFTNVIYF